MIFLNKHHILFLGINCVYIYARFVGPYFYEINSFLLFHKLIEYFSSIGVEDYPLGIYS